MKLTPENLMAFAVSFSFIKTQEGDFPKDTDIFEISQWIAIVSRKLSQRYDFNKDLLMDSKWVRAMSKAMVKYAQRVMLKKGERTLEEIEESSVQVHENALAHCKDALKFLQKQPRLQRALLTSRRLGLVDLNFN